MDEDDNDIVIALRRGDDGWEYAAADEIEALRAENARLRTVLKPFADEAENIADFAQDDLVWEHWEAATVGQIRAARAAMRDEVKS